MKNELGIEVCCGFCAKSFYSVSEMKDCEKNPNKHFKPTDLIKTARIKELQEQVKELESENNGVNEYYQQQQFTEEELQFIKNRLDELIEEWDVPEMVFMAHQILKKIERIINEQ